MKNILELAIVIPVYNEEGAIEEVIHSWMKVLKGLLSNFQVHVFDDGSKDGTLAILESLKGQYEELFVHTQENQGHGPTILKGYNLLLSAQWIFQLDSDNEIKAEYFKNLWDRRHEFDFLIGQRSNRQSPLVRRLISGVALLIVNIFYGSGVKDINSPFRLMKTIKFQEVIPCIPHETFAPNVIISGIACAKKLNILEIQVPYQFRQTGTVSIRKLKLIKAAVRSFWQTVMFAFKNRTVLVQ